MFSFPDVLTRDTRLALHPACRFIPSFVRLLWAGSGQTARECGRLVKILRFMDLGNFAFFLQPPGSFQRQTLPSQSSHVLLFFKIYFSLAVLGPALLIWAFLVS